MPTPRDYLHTYTPSICDRNHALHQGGSVGDFESCEGMTSVSRARQKPLASRLASHECTEGCYRRDALPVLFM